MGFSLVQLSFVEILHFLSPDIVKIGITLVECIGLGLKKMSWDVRVQNVQYVNKVMQISYSWIVFFVSRFFQRNLFSQVHIKYIIICFESLSQWNWTNQNYRIYKKNCIKSYDSITMPTSALNIFSRFFRTFYFFQISIFLFHKIA